MKLHPRVSRSLVELVKRFEGLRRRAARLPEGGWTIGYGHTKSAREGVEVTPEDAEALLYYDLSEVAEKVDAWTFTPLNQNQFEALTAFAFNIGPENFRRSTVLKRVNEGQHLQAAAALELWRKADFGGEDLVIDALVRRRAAEKAHYLTPPEGFRPSPTPVLKPTFDHSVIEAAALARAGRPAAVVDAPLDGEEAAAHLERPPEDAPHAAALTAAPASANLHSLFAKEPEPQPEDAPAPKGDTHPELAAAAFDAPVGEAAAAATPLDDASPEPEPPIQEPHAPGYIGFGALQPPAAFEPAEPPPPEAPTPIAAAPVEALPATPLFDLPSLPAEPVRTARLRADEPLDNGRADDFDPDRLSHEHPAKPHDRSIIYLSVGLLGVALFAAALFSMLGGKATAVNLIIGLMGILFMTPAGGYFLLRFLDKGQTSPEL